MSNAARRARRERPVAAREIKPKRALARRCREITKKGTPCKNPPVGDTDLCSSHKGTAHRPTKFTEETRKAIMTVLQRGGSRHDAALWAAISPDTFADWISQGRAEERAGAEGAFAAFHQQVIHAEAEHKLALLTTVTVAATVDKDADMALKLLERKDPGGFAKLDRHLHEHSGHVDVEHLLGGAQPVDLRPETRQKIAQALAEDSEGGDAEVVE